MTQTALSLPEMDASVLVIESILSRPPTTKLLSYLCLAFPFHRVQVSIFVRKEGVEEPQPGAKVGKAIMTNILDI